LSRDLGSETVMRRRPASGTPAGPAQAAPDGTVALSLPPESQSRIARMLRWSDGDGEVVEGDAEPVVSLDVGGDVVVAAAQVLHEGVTGGQDPCWPVPLQTAHRPEPGSEPPVIRLHRVVRVPLRGVPGRGDQLAGHPGAGGGTAGGDRGGDRSGLHRADDEAPGGRQVAPDRERDVDDQASWPAARYRYARWPDTFTYVSPASHRSPGAWRHGRAASMNSGGEPLHPPVDSDVINGDTALGQQFFDVPAGQSVPQVPADRDRDHLRREPQAPKTSQATSRNQSP